MTDIRTGVLAGKCALVTGASRGIGRAIAQRLASEGATVVVTARSLARSATTAGTLAETVALIEQAGGRAIALAADLSNAAERDALVGRAAQAAGGLDILVNNAGVADYACVDAMPMTMFDTTIEHYLRIPFALAQAAIPLMRARGAGWIVNVGSVTALPPLRPFDDFSRAGGATVYAAAKAALSRFTQGLAAELEADGIAVNLVAPSTAIRTPGARATSPKAIRPRMSRISRKPRSRCAACRRANAPASSRTACISRSRSSSRCIRSTAARCCRRR